MRRCDTPDACNTAACSTPYQGRRVWVRGVTSQGACRATPPPFAESAHRRILGAHAIAAFLHPQLDPKQPTRSSDALPAMRAALFVLFAVCLGARAQVPPEMLATMFSGDQLTDAQAEMAQGELPRA